MKPYHEKPKFDYVELGMLKHAVNVTLDNIALELAEQDDEAVKARLRGRRRCYLGINYKIIELLATQVNSK